MSVKPHPKGGRLEVIVSVDGEEIIRVNGFH